MRREQHVNSSLPHHHRLDPTALLGKSEQAVLFASRAITPHTLEFLAKEISELWTADAEEMIDVAAAARGSSVSVDSGAGGIGTARDHLRSIEHHEFVVHQATASAAVFRVVDQGDPGVQQQRYGIGIGSLRWGGDAVLIAIGQLIELLPLPPLIFGQMDSQLAAPGGAVGVFQNHVDLEPALLSSDQGLGDTRQRQLLDGHQDFALCRVNRIHQGLFEVVAVAPYPGERAAVATSIAVVEQHLNAFWQG